MMRLPLIPEVYNGGLPTGGTTGQVLAKNSGTDFDVGWVTGGGGITALTGDVTASGTGSVAATIAAGAVTVSKMANLAASTILGNNTGVPAAPIALSTGQVKTLLAIAAGDVSGLAAIATSGSAADLSAGTVPAARMPALTGDVTSSAGTVATTIANDAVTNAKAANMATATIKGRATAGTGDPEDLTGTQATALLDTFTSGAKGLVPPSGGGTTTFLRADGTFAAPAGGGGTTNLAYDAATRTVSSDTGTDAVLTMVNNTNPGLAARPEVGPSRFYSFNDCMANATNSPDWTNAVSGTGAAFSVQPPQDGGNGWLRLALGTTAIGRGAIHSPGFNVFALSSGPSYFAARVRINTLSDATNTYSIRCGFLDSVSAEPFDGVFFRYTHSVLGGNWQAVCRYNNNEATSSADTGVTVAVATTYKLEVYVNAAGTAATFYINGTLVATITSNIPFAVGRESGYGFMALRSAGTAAVSCFDLDYVLVEQLMSGRS